MVRLVLTVFCAIAVVAQTSGTTSPTGLQISTRGGPRTVQTSPVTFVTRLILPYLGDMALRGQTVVHGTGGLVAVPGYVSPIAYGAVCDGSTDDTAALQAAITEAAGTLPVVISKPCVGSGLRLPSATTIQCASGGSLKHNGAGSTVLLSPAAGASAIRIYDCELIGVATDATTTTVGFQANTTSVSDIKITRCNIHNFNQNIALSGIVSDVEISSDYIHDAIGTTAGHGYGLVATGSSGTVTNIRTHDNVFRNNQRHSVYYATGVTKSSAINNDIYHSFVGANSAMVAWSPIVGNRTTFVTYKNNRIYSPYYRGIEIDDGADHITVEGNEIYDPATTAECILVLSQTPASLDVSRFINVKNNFCRTGQVGAASIFVGDATDVLVQANTVQGTGAITAYEQQDSAKNASRRVVFRDNIAIGTISVGYRVNSNGASPLLQNNRALPASTEFYDGSGGTGTPVFEDTHNEH